MKIKAAVLTKIGKPLEIQKIDLAPPKANEVLVKIAASGICHSDLIAQHSQTALTPAVLGHEGAGIVVEVGENVKTVKPGDKVTLSWIPYCGVCSYCTNNQVHLCDSAFEPMVKGFLPDGTSRLSKDGKIIYHDSLLSTNAEYAVVHEMSCVKLPEEMPLKQAALLGCGVATGYGAAVNGAKVTPGSTVAVFGCGGVGINAIQGSKIIGASKIIACDVKEANLDVALKFGATHTINVSKENVVERLRELSDGLGVQYAIDATGNTKATAMAFEGTRKGGTVVVVGFYTEKELTISAELFHRKGKILRGSSYGDINPIRDIRNLAQLYLDGKLMLDELIINEIKLEEINKGLEAFHDKNSINVGRTVVVLDESL
jgi:S-(hydroxymethyl)glutathione dehydrogenase / alcohol dehydrogenase